MKSLFSVSVVQVQYGGQTVFLHRLNGMLPIYSKQLGTVICFHNISQLANKYELHMYKALRKVTVISELMNVIKMKPPNNDEGLGCMIDCISTALEFLGYVISNVCLVLHDILHLTHVLVVHSSSPRQIPATWGFS